MKLRITPDDLKKGKLVTPGWYVAEVTDVTEKPAGTDGSMNWNIQLKIIGTEFDGVPVYRTFNEKGAGFAVTFVEAFNVRIDEKSGVEIDLKRTVGKKLKIYVKNEMYNNAMKNNVADFSPLESTEHPTAEATSTAS